MLLIRKFIPFNSEENLVLSCGCGEQAILFLRRRG